MNNNDREVIITRVLAAPRELVWKAMTDPKYIVNYWGPDGFTTTIESMDLRINGEWWYTMIGPDGTCYPNHSVFKEIVPLSKLVYDHGDGERIWFEQTITLQDVEGGTLVTLRHLFPTKGERDMVVEKYGAIEGGKQHLAKLETYIKENLA
jgi:uncharacterized protein YndB with AHSA1/START domain